MQEARHTEEELRAQMEELYLYYFRKARAGYDAFPEIEQADANQVWEIGRASGANEAIQTLYLYLYGGKAAMELWLRALAVTEGKAENA